MKKKESENIIMDLFDSFFESIEMEYNIPPEKIEYLKSKVEEDIRYIESVDKKIFRKK